MFLIKRTSIGAQYLISNFMIRSTEAAPFAGVLQNKCS